MHAPRKAPLALALLLAAGCPKPDDSTITDDTAEDTGDPVVYEEGCITVDGGDGYASLNDAIHLASEGSTIEICEGSFEEAVVVDKAVTIVGAGADLTLWTAPSNEVAFSFQGVTGAGLSGVGITTTRSGIEIENSADVDLGDLAFDLVPNYAIAADDTTGLTIADSSFVENQWGAVKINAGDGTITGCTFVDNLGFAIKATGGADLVAQQNEISGTMYTELGDKGEISDGFALFFEEAGDVTLTENVLEDNPIVGIWAMEGDALSMSGDSITGGLYGIYMIYGDLEMQDVTIVDPTEFGVLWAAPAGEVLSADGLQVSGDPDVVSDYEWDSGYLGSIGLYVEGDHVDLSNSTISGYNCYGAYMVAYGTDDGEAILDTVTFDNNGQRGILSVDLDVVATDLTISNLRELDDDYDGYIYIDLPAGWYHQSANLELTGGSISNNEGWGISASQANVDIQEVTFEGNTRAGLIDYAGTSNLQGNTFTGSLDTSSFGALCAYQSNGMTAIGNTFSGNSIVETEYSYTDAHGNETLYVYHDKVPDSGLDLYAYDASVTVQNNTFENGYLGLQVYASDATVSQNAFTNYSYASIYVGGEGSDSVILEENTVTGNVGYGLMASSADVEVQDLTVSDGQIAEISYDYYYNGELYFSSSYTTSYDGIYASYSNLLLEDVVVDSPAGDGIYSYNSTLELDDVTITNASSQTSYSYALYLYHYNSTHTAADVEIHSSGLTIEDAQGYGGIYLVSNDATAFVAAQFVDTEISWSEGTDAGTYGVNVSSVGSGDEAVVSFEGLEITGAGGNGIYLSDASVSLSDAQITGSTGDGVAVNSSTLTVDSSTLSDNQGDGFGMTNGTLTVSDSTVTGNTEDGLAVSTGRLTLSDSEVGSNLGDGVDLTAATATVTGNIITSNGSYGITCTTTSFDGCGDNTITDNTLADNNGCDASCGDPLSGGETGL